MKEHLKQFYQEVLEQDQAGIDRQLEMFMNIHVGLKVHGCSETLIDQINVLYAEMSRRASTMKAALNTLAHQHNTIDKSDLSKLEKALAIYDRLSAIGTPRKDIIERIMATLAMSKAGASSYYQQARNRSETSMAVHEEEVGSWFEAIGAG